MPTKAGVLKASEYRNGKTIWFVSQIVKTDGTVDILPPKRADCYTAPYPAHALECGIEPASIYEYDTHLVEFIIGVGVLVLTMEQLGHLSKGANPNQTERVKAFATRKAAERFYKHGEHYEATIYDVAQARSDDSTKSLFDWPLFVPKDKPKKYKKRYLGGYRR